jgi:cyclopropane-fatty-acyl-phospholipid synthase
VPARAQDLGPGVEAPSVPTAAARRAGAIDRWFATRVQRRIQAAAVRLELWDGSAPGFTDGPTIGALVARDRGTVLGLALYPDLYFGETYTAGRLQIRGSLQPVVEALSRASACVPAWWERAAARLAFPNTLTGSRQNVHHHYDLGNRFYEQWLDDAMVYTCAYFGDPSMTLEQAQRAKLDLVCRKLQLRPGDTVIEAGCGWGALALHMARHYGARVKAFNVSHEQLAYARGRAAREGLASRVEFIDDDYRNVRGQYDAFVSIGMLEHVGLQRFTSLAYVLRRSLRRDGGRGLLHFIGRDVPRPTNAWIRKRIFPGCYTPTVAEVATRVLGPAGMSIVDVENLRLHYAQTLAHWSSRFAAVRQSVQHQFGDEFTRAWELYLAGSQAAFATGWLQLFQIVFAPAGSAPPYTTRSDIYRRGANEDLAIDE